VKCDENGGCPIGARVLSGPEPITVCAMTLNIDCHLTPDLFPLIRAMLAGNVEIIPKGKEALFDDDGDYDEECFLIAIRQPKEGVDE